MIASPYVFYQIWTFVAAGLYPHEKNYVFLYLPISILLFVGGASLAFLFVFDPVLDFLFLFNKGMNADFDPRIGEWLGFVLMVWLVRAYSASRVNVFVFLSPVFGVLIGWAALGETMSALQALGALAVAAGILIVTAER